MGQLRSKCELQSVDADFGEGPVTVYYRPLSISQMDKIEQAAKVSPMTAIVESLILRCLDESGKRMFDGRKDHPHRSKIENDFDPDEVIRVVTAMNQRAVDPGN